MTSTAINTQDLNSLETMHDDLCALEARISEKLAKVNMNVDQGPFWMAGFRLSKVLSGFDILTGTLIDATEEAEKAIKATGGNVVPLRPFQA